MKRIVKMKFRKESVETFLNLFESVKFKISGLEDCHSLELVQAFDEQTFFTISIWENEEALNAYRNSEMFKETWTVVKTLLEIKAEAWSTDSLFKV
jgi:heme-degrading monooxygenase HmoA